MNADSGRNSSARLPAESFFLPALPGQRFCIYHAPHPDTACRGALIYVHPFGDEMNRSRHMVAVQARLLAEKGYGVLLIDLFGCGDSTGEFGDARWEIWLTDLALAKQWLEDRLFTRIGLWGLRLGALLALDFAHSGQSRMAPLILWQPVISGKSFMTELLRMRVAGDMLSEAVTLGHDRKAPGTQALRSALRAGESLEIGGYEIAPALAFAIEALDVKALPVNTAPTHWFNIVRPVEGVGYAHSPALVEVIDAWQRQGADLRMHTAPGLPFWATQELSECPELLSMTTALLENALVSPA